MSVLIDCYCGRFADLYETYISDDDYAAYVLARELGKPDDITQMLFNRSMTNAFQLFNDETGFMEARNANGSWAEPDTGCTEGTFYDLRSWEIHAKYSYTTP